MGDKGHLFSGRRGSHRMKTTYHHERDKRPECAVEQLIDADDLDMDPIVNVTLRYMPATTLNAVRIFPSKLVRLTSRTTGQSELTLIVLEEISFG